MNGARLAVVALTALCVALLGGRGGRAEEERDYTVVVKKVEVEKTKADGKAWDIDEGKPDLAVTVRNVSRPEDKEFTTKTRDDTFSADLNEPTTIKVRPGQTLEFEVTDKDVALGDTVGKVSKEMTAQVLEKGVLRLEKFGQVIRLEVQVKKL